MKRHSAEVIKQVETLRRKGMSIPEIMTATGLPKTTIWHNVQDIILDEDALGKIRSKQGGSKQRSEMNWEKAKKFAEEILSESDDRREISLAAAMLYWAEGSKRELVFTNTDISMIRLYLLFIQRVLKIVGKDTYLLIRISDPIVPEDALKYWHVGTNISESNIRINHNNIQNKTKTKYGICRVFTKKGGYSLKVIQCMIDIVKNEF
jgi:hypothetical protein